ncbi:MAG: FAD-binding protein [Burkholderiales bacterium]|nr:FAD-binding protein [Burkholderiales bacterium]
MLARYVVRDPDNLYLRSNSWSTGDGFLAATAIGAAASRGLDTFYGHALAAPPARFSKLQFRDVSQSYGRRCVAVNLNGERFADESDNNTEAALNQRLAQQPQGRGFYIVDQKIMDSPAIDGEEILVRVSVERAKAANGPVVRADTLEDLCRQLAASFGVPEKRLFRELTGFNALIESGRADELEPPRRANRYGLSHAPFHAVGVKASITYTMGGLRIDERARVLRRSGGTSSFVTMPTTESLREIGPLCTVAGPDFRETAIEGLYAAGCDTGNISHFGYMGGLAPALVTGRVAGNSAAQFIRNRAA